MYKVERISDGKIMDYDKFIVECLVGKIQSNYSVNKVRAKELLFESLSMNMVVDEIMDTIEYKLEEEKKNA